MRLLIFRERLYCRRRLSLGSCPPREFFRCGSRSFFKKCQMSLARRMKFAGHNNMISYMMVKIYQRPHFCGFELLLPRAAIDHTVFQIKTFSI